MALSDFAHIHVKVTSNDPRKFNRWKLYCALKKFTSAGWLYRAAQCNACSTHHCRMNAVNRFVNECHTGAYAQFAHWSRAARGSAGLDSSTPGPRSPIYDPGLLLLLISTRAWPPPASLHRLVPLARSDRKFEASAA